MYGQFKNNNDHISYVSKSYLQRAKKGLEVSATNWRL